MENNTVEFYEMELDDRILKVSCLGSLLSY